MSNCRYAAIVNISLIILTLFLSFCWYYIRGSKSLQTENGIDKYLFNPLHVSFPFYKKSIYFQRNHLSTFVAHATMMKSSQNILWNNRYLAGDSQPFMHAAVIYIDILSPLDIFVSKPLERLKPVPQRYLARCRKIVLMTCAIQEQILI